LKKKIIDELFVVKAEKKKKAGQCEHYVIIRDRKEILHSHIDPYALSDPLAFGAMSISARVAKAVLIAALVAHIHVISKCAFPAMFDIVHDPVLLETHLVFILIRVTIQPEDVGYLVLLIM
jgi:hypothetical protein